MKPAKAWARIQFKNILFATDFSPASAAAVPFASELARRYGAKLYALHVRPPAVDLITPPEAWRGLEEAAKEEEEQHTKELLNAFAGIQPEILIKEGGLWSSLTNAIEENNVDLIVMGTRGRSGIQKLLLGSTAEKIFRQAPCPVLAIGPNAWVSGKQAGEISRILFATDFNPESNAAPYAVSLAQEYEAGLTLLHVIEESRVSDVVRAAEMVKSSAQQLRDLVPSEAALWCVSEYLVEQGDAAETILEVAARRRAELIVLGARRPSGIPGVATHLPIAVAHKVVSHAACPVLIVRD